MTPEEQAESIVNRFGDTSASPSKADISAMIAANIRYAVAAAVEAEREECAEICHEYGERARIARHLADGMSMKRSGDGHHNRVIAAQELEAEIRARKAQ